MSAFALAGDPWAVALLVVCGAIVAFVVGLLLVDEVRWRLGRRRVARGKVVRFTGRRARRALARELGPGEPSGDLWRVETFEGRPVWVNLLERDARYLAATCDHLVRVRRQTRAEEDADREAVDGVLVTLRKAAGVVER